MPVGLSRPDMDAALVAEDVRKEYGETAALDGVSLSVREGEVLALVGPNGAGKTTLVRVLTGTTEPTAGEVRTLGERPATLDRHRLGVLPQSFAPPGRLTAGELMAYYAGLYDDARDPGTVLAEVGLADAADTWYERLSGGQRRRACLGAALVNEPELLVLDEPTTGIDPAGRRTVREHVAGLAEGGTTVLVTTHDMDEAERLADRVALLADGRLRAVGPPEDLIREHGGQPRVVVDVGDDAEGAVDALTDAGLDATADEGRVVVSGVDPERIGSVVDALDGAGVTYEGLAWRRPSLEDAYMELAGEDETGGRQDGAVGADGRGNAPVSKGGDRS